MNLKLGTLKKQASLQKQASFQMKWLEVKTTEEGKIRIKGFASTPQIDRYDDIVNPSAFANAMTQYMANPVVLLGHSADKVLGKVIEYNLSNAGLEITAELSNDIENTFHNIMEKNLRGFSIGFICKSYNLREENNREIREITELDLVEISVVSTPANPSSLFTLAKSLRLLFSEAEEKESENVEVEAGEPAPEEAPEAPEGKPDQTQEEEKGKKPSKKEDDEDDEDEEEPEIASNKDDQNTSKTEKEAPAGETPATPEGETQTVDVPASDNSDPVKAEEKTEETPTPVGITEDEVKSLIAEAVKTATATLAEKIEELKATNEATMKAIDEIVSAYSVLEEKHATLEKSHKTLEGDFLKIEVRTDGKAYKSTPARPTTIVTDARVLKSLGL
jgi:HK97 family phage prohead protease